jgi:uncharacterized protein (DUF885 family)
MKLFYSLACIIVFFGCAQDPAERSKSNEKDKDFKAFIDNYYHQRMALFPIEATMNGDTLYNDKLYASFTDSFIANVHSFYTRTLDTLHNYDREKLSENDKISFDYMNEYVTMLDKDLSFHSNWIPTDQIWGLHLIIGQWATGEGSQPFKTVRDYDNWLKRMTAFGPWLDSAIVYFQKGSAANYTLPKPLVRSMIPQFEFMVTKDAASNLFYSPLKRFPSTFSEEDKKRLTDAYTDAITNVIIPGYRRMAEFLKNEYLHSARSSTTGISELSDGAEHYKLLVRLQTTTDKTPDEIYNIGLSEVKRIRGLMEKIKDSVGFKGDMKAFFKFVNTDPQFTPYKTPEDVLNAFRAIQQRIQPGLPALFSKFPKTPFEIRRTEAFREASASAEYLASPDNIKPGIFYVPIIDAKKFNITSGMQSLFLHEAIPGHHFQISLQKENKDLPLMRRFDPVSNAYVEGWALYCESLGQQLNVYDNPYQYFGSLGDEMHRAIRLVVDVALHTKGMTREEAIKYMMENEQISLQGATAEIERYISGPGQALGYKMGQLKIIELRNKYQQLLGDKFSIQDFHTEFLKDGSMPLTVLESKMDRWANSVNK